MTWFKRGDLNAPMQDGTYKVVYLYNGGGLMPMVKVEISCHGHLSVKIYHVDFEQDIVESLPKEISSEQNTDHPLPMLRIHKLRVVQHGPIAGLEIKTLGVTPQYVSAMIKFLSSITDCFPDLYISFVPNSHGMEAYSVLAEVLEALEARNRRFNIGRTYSYDHVFYDLLQVPIPSTPVFIWNRSIPLPPLFEASTGTQRPYRIHEKAASAPPEMTEEAMLALLQTDEEFPLMMKHQ